MPIVGLTVSESGEPIQRLAVTTKVAIGETKKASNGKLYPSKLDHFIFLRKNQKNEWEPDPTLMKAFGESCREVWIVLMSDPIENVFRTELAWWSATEKKCSGDGRTATRRTDKNPEGEPWSPCGDACPEREQRKCKPSGDLYFMLADYPKIGGACRIHTTGRHSVQQIYSALEQIRTMTAGRLAGIRCKMTVVPEQSTYFDEAKNSKVRTIVYTLNLEVAADDMKKLLSEMTKYAQLFEQTRKMLGTAKYVIDDEAEEERAPDITQEFYPPSEIQPAAEIKQPVRVSEPTEPNGNGHTVALPERISKAQRKVLAARIVDVGWSNQQAKEILRDRWGFQSTEEITIDKYDAILAMFSQLSIPDEEYQATNEDIPF